MLAAPLAVSAIPGKDTLLWLRGKVRRMTGTEVTYVNYKDVPIFMLARRSDGVYLLLP